MCSNSDGTFELLNSIMYVGTIKPNGQTINLEDSEKDNVNLVMLSHVEQVLRSAAPLDALRATVNVVDVRPCMYKCMCVKERKKMCSTHNQTYNRCLIYEGFHMCICLCVFLELIRMSAAVSSLQQTLHSCLCHTHRSHLGIRSHATC